MSLEPQPDEVRYRAAAVNEILGQIGLSGVARDEWWSTRPYEVLGGRTPSQAWQRGDYATVEMIVEDWCYAVEHGAARPGSAGPMASSG